MSHNAGESNAIWITIVDDEDSVRVGMRRLCQARGFKADSFASGQAFLDSIEQGAGMPDCVLLDAHMPGMNGLELQRRLRARDAQVPIVLVTADDSPEVLARYRSAGLSVQLRKPFSGDEMFTAIEHAMNEPRASPLSS